MIKFKTELDEKKFLLEIGATEATPEICEAFIERRTSRVKKMVDFRKSQDSKASWRRNRYKMLKGVRSWHKSTEGKRFHRQLGRFLATRISKNESFDKYGTLKAVTSIRTHLFIEGEFYRDLEAESDFVLLAEYSLPLLQSIENKIFENRLTEITEDELELLARLTSPQEVLMSLQELNYKPPRNVKFDENNESSYGYLLEYLKIVGAKDRIKSLTLILESDDDDETTA